MTSSPLASLRFRSAALRDRLRIALRRHTDPLRARSLRGLPSPLHLHLGCGNVYKPSWVNIDTYAAGPCRPDLLLDLSRPLPFPSASAVHIYSEHFFEHLPFPAAAFSHLADCLRILAPGGIIEIGVPEPREVLSAYLEDRPHPYFDYFDHSPFVARHLGTRMEAVNWLFRQNGEHHFIYDEPTLTALLLRIGFIDPRPRPWRADLDSEARRSATLYMTARRPA